MTYDNRSREELYQEEVDEAGYELPPTRRQVVERQIRREVRIDDPYEPLPPNGPLSRHQAEREMAAQAAMQRDVVVRITQVIWLLTGVLVSLIGIRFVLKLLAANPGAGFAQFVYQVTDAFLAPFAGLTATPSAAGIVLEIPALIAMLVYALLGWVIVRLIWILLIR